MNTENRIYKALYDGKNMKTKALKKALNFHGNLSRILQSMLKRKMLRLSKYGYTARV